MKSILLEEAYRTIKVNEGAGQITVPMAQAVIRSLAVNAAKGNQRAQRLFTELLFTTERENKRLHDEWLDVAITYKIEWERELARRERLGIAAGPEPLPHPDHVVINIRTGEVSDQRSGNKGGKGALRTVGERQDRVPEEIEELEQLLSDEPNYQYRKQVLADIEHNKKMLEIVKRVIPD